MGEMVGEFIELALGNFTVTFLVIGLLVALIVIAVRRPGRAGVAATLLSWFLFFAIGVTYVFNAVMHIAFGGFTASLIGWADSPFQTEVGYASLGFGVVGFIAFPKRMPLSLKFAAIVGPACFLWGAASAHIVDIVETGNFSPDNAGPILYTDLLVPVLGFALWWFAAATARGQAQAAREESVREADSELGTSPASV